MYLTMKRWSNIDLYFSQKRQVRRKHGLNRSRNCKELLQYIKHKLYGFDFTEKMQLVEKDSIFVPAGADSITKIKVDFESQVSEIQNLSHQILEPNKRSR